MGSFDLTCAVSGLPLTAGTPVVSCALQRGYDDGPVAGFCVSPWDEWWVVGVPIAGHYEDYGRADLRDDDAVRLTLDVVAAAGWRRQARSGPDEPFAPVAFDDLLDAADRRGRRVVDRRGRPLTLSHTVLHADVYAGLADDPDTRARLATPPRGHLAGLRDSATALLAELEEDGAEDESLAGLRVSLAALGRRDLEEYPSARQLAPLLWEHGDERAAPHLARPESVALRLSLLQRQLRAAVSGGQEVAWRERLEFHDRGGTLLVAAAAAERAAADDEDGEDDVGA